MLADGAGADAEAAVECVYLPPSRRVSKMAAPPELRVREPGVWTQGGSSEGIPVPF